MGVGGPPAAGVVAAAIVVRGALQTGVLFVESVMGFANPERVRLVE